MAKMIAFATRKNASDVRNTIVNAGGKRYITQVKMEKAVTKAIVANGIKAKVNGEALGIFVTEETVFNAIASQVDVVATIDMEAESAAVKAVNANYPSRMDKVTYKAYQADVAKARAGVVKIVGVDAVETPVANPFKVGDYVHEYHNSHYNAIRTPWKVIKVTAKSYTVAPLMPKITVRDGDTAENNFNNVENKFPSSKWQGHMEDFTIPVKGNEDKFEVQEFAKKTLRVKRGQTATIAESSPLFSYNYYFDGMR